MGLLMITVILILIIILLILSYFFFLRGAHSETHIHPMIEKIKEIGELSFYRLFLKEILIKSSSILKEGKPFFKFLVSDKKMILIIDFIVDFKVNLKDPGFVIRSDNDRNMAVFELPPIIYSVMVKDICFIDEKDAKVLPLILPEIVAPKFRNTVEDRNKLIQEGKKVIEEKTQEFLRNNETELKRSIENTLKGLALGFNFTSVEFFHSSSGPIMNRIDTSAIEKAIPLKK